MKTSIGKKVELSVESEKKLNFKWTDRSSVNWYSCRISEFTCPVSHFVLSRAMNPPSDCLDYRSVVEALSMGCLICINLNNLTVCLNIRTLQHRNYWIILQHVLSIRTLQYDNKLDTGIKLADSSVAGVDAPEHPATITCPSPWNLSKKPWLKPHYPFPPRPIRPFLGF